MTVLTTSAFMERNRPLASLTDTWTAEFLAVAYGEDERNKAMRLPSELRESLYSQVLSYGPAVEKVAELIDAVAANYPSREVAAHLKEIVRENPLNGNTRGWYLFFSEWCAEEGLLDLQQNLEDIVDLRVAWDKEKSLAIYMVTFLLTVQEIWPPSMARESKKLVKQVNRLLGFLDMPPLGGVFASLKQ